MIFPAGTCTQHLYGDACIKVPAPFFFSYFGLGQDLPYSLTLCRARPCPHFFFRGPSLHLLPTVFLRNSTERVDPPVLATYPTVSSPRAPRRRQRNQPARCGGAAFFFFTRRPGRLSLPSVAYEFTSIPGRVQFLFFAPHLVAFTRIRASVSTPP